MPIKTSTVVTTQGATAVLGHTRPMNMLLVDGVAQTESTVFEVAMGSPMLLEQFGMEPGAHVDIISVTYTSKEVTVHACGESAYDMATAVVCESNAQCGFLSPVCSRALLTMPGHYRLVLRPPTVAGTFSIRRTCITPEVAALFDDCSACCSTPQTLPLDASGVRALYVPNGCTATVTGLMPPDTVLGATVEIGGTYVSATDAHGGCLCASNVDVTPLATGTFVLPAGSYNLDTFPSRPGMIVTVAYTCT